jgi:hypothetical protein
MLRKRIDSMSGAMGHRRARILGVALATAAIAGVAAPVAGATTVRTDAIKINGGTADFGSGQHSLGSPQGSGTDVWGFTASGGTLNVSAHLTGTLYWDSLDPGCARVVVHFEDRFGHDLITPKRPPDACGPGGDANLTSNQRQVNYSYSSPQLDEVVVQTRQVNPNGALSGGGTSDDFEPLVSNHQPLINSGTADFGGSGSHMFGAPTTSAEVDIDKGTGTMSAYITGRLFWDALFSSGCPQLAVDYLDVNNTVLKSAPPQSFCGPGGDANNSANWRDVSLNYSNPALYRVRLRVGSLAGSSFVNVTTVTYSFA